MLKNMGVSAAAGLLLGIAVITLIDRTAATGGAEFDRFGKAAIVLISTAICTVIGAVLRHVHKPPRTERATYGPAARPVSYPPWTARR